MDAVLFHPRVRELLREITEAQQLALDLTDDSEARREVKDALDQLHRDLGRLVSRIAANQSIAPMVPETEHADEGFTNELPEDEDDGWYTSEVARQDGPLFDPGDLPNEHTDVPEPDPVPPDWTEEDGTDATYFIEKVDRIAARAQNAGSALALYRSDAPPTWAPRLTELTKLMAMPASFDDEEELAVETSRVQWLSSQLGAKLDGFPAEVQLCLIAALGARAQSLRMRLDIDVGPRMTLDRLSRYRVENGFPTVASLLANPTPEGESWEADARAWWALIR